MINEEPNSRLAGFITHGSVQSVLSRMPLKLIRHRQ